jgi:hypothetical protein
MLMSEVIGQALREYVPEEDGNPFASWAGECGMFVDVACQIADEHGVQYEIGNAYCGKLEGDFKLVPPPGVTINEMHSFDIIRNINHIWLIHDDKHFDGSTTEGVGSIFDLRVTRQVAVELIRRIAPERLTSLSAEHEYWRESEHLFDEYTATLANLRVTANVSVKDRRDRSPSFDM